MLATSQPHPTHQSRRFWQIHLSTAIVVLLIISALMYLNSDRFRPNADPFQKGWPCNVVFKSLDDDVTGLSNIDYSRKEIWIDLFTWVALIGGAGLLTEYKIRNDAAGSN